MTGRRAPPGLATAARARREPEPERGRGRQADRARLRGAALEVALPLEDREVVVDGGGGGEAHRLGDLAHDGG